MTKTQLQISGAAIASDGKSAVQTTKVINSLEGSKVLKVTLTNTTGAAVNNVHIKRGAHQSMRTHPLQGAITFSAPGFADYESMQDYFRGIQTTIAGFEATTNDPNNFNSDLIFLEKDPSGEDRTVRKNLEKFKLPLGGGTFAPTIVVPASEFRATLWEALVMLMETIQPNSYVTFRFNVKGWNKSKELTALRNSNM